MAKTAADFVFVDTNILVYSSNPAAPEHQKALETISRLRSKGTRFCCSTQVLREYLVVETNLSRIKGQGPEKLKEILENYEKLLSTLLILPETTASAQLLPSLVVKHARSGRHIHDLNIIAVMLTHGVQRLLTNNASDFSNQVQEIEVLPLWMAN